MQNLWKKLGAVAGSAFMVGATLAGAAFAQADGKDLGDFQDLMISSNGNVQGLFVVGAEAATADVVSMANVAAYVGQHATKSGTTSGEGQISLTPLTAGVNGVARHVQFDQNASLASEFGTTGATTDLISTPDYASGAGAVTWLYSDNEKGQIFANGTQFEWHEELRVTLGNIDALRDNLDSDVEDQYDEVFLSIDSSSLEYRHIFDDNIAQSSLQQENMFFLGEEYVVIDADASGGELRLGGVESEVFMKSGETVTQNAVDVTLDGIFSTGSNSAFQAKVTITSGGKTSTAFINSGESDTVAGVEVFVKSAVVTTSGTNAGEAELIIGGLFLPLLYYVPDT